MVKTLKKKNFKEKLKVSCRDIIEKTQYTSLLLTALLSVILSTYLLGVWIGLIVFFLSLSQIGEFLSYVAMLRRVEKYTTK